VLEQLRSLMRAPALLSDAIAHAKRRDATLNEAKVTVAMNRLDAIWAQMFPAEQTRMIRLMVEKVIVSPKQLEVRLRANGIERLILDMRPDATLVTQALQAVAA
jgi:site-specific DNA recombinase